jgi:hypothetical protein
MIAPRRRLELKIGRIQWAVAEALAELNVGACS